VLKINPFTQEVTVLADGTLPKGHWKWHGGLASKDRSKIIGFPNNADSVLVIDVMTQRVRMVGDSSILRSGYHRVPNDGGYKYLGGSITSDGKFAYLFPCDAEYVLRFDLETEELRLVGPQLTEGENKFQNGRVLLTHNSYEQRIFCTNNQNLIGFSEEIIAYMEFPKGVLAS
jgi:hypothetical protein